MRLRQAKPASAEREERSPRAAPPLRRPADL